MIERWGQRTRLMRLGYGVIAHRYHILLLQLDI